jgi:hypothetical protein
VIRLIPGPTPIRGDGESLDAAGRARLRTAALKARRIYPGHLGLLAARELNALADHGIRFDGDALIPRIAAEILAADLPEGAAGY